MDYQTELDLLASWYHLTLFLSLTVPLLYLYIHRHSHKYLSYLMIQIFLCLLTALADFALYTEAYNLARPVYVCFEPVRGETFHAPEETRLKVQWALYTIATCLALVAAVLKATRGRKWSLGERIEKDELLRLLGDDVRCRTFEKGSTIPGSWVEVRKVDEEVVYEGHVPGVSFSEGRDEVLYEKDELESEKVEEKRNWEEIDLQGGSGEIMFLDGAVYMVAAWVVAVVAFLIMYGREKKGAFG